MTVTIETPFTQGEVPLAALTYQYLDGDDVPLVGITDEWMATLRIKHSDGSTVELDATIDDTATATYEWEPGVLDTPGVDQAEFWITDGTKPEIASDRILWRVRAAIPSSGS